SWCSCRPGRTRRCAICRGTTRAGCTSRSSSPDARGGEYVDPATSGGRGRHRRGRCPPFPSEGGALAGLAAADLVAAARGRRIVLRALQVVPDLIVRDGHPAGVLLGFEAP